MSPVLQVDKDEWEAFRAEFSKLTKNYELVLGKLELAQVQIRELNQQNEALRREGRGTVGPTSQGAAESVKRESEGIRQGEPDKKPGEAELRGKQKPGFWESLRIRLSRLPRRPQSSYAVCRRCGYLIREASRFCSGCGTNFGALICPCGRDLPRDANYCDRCGRRSELS